MLTLNCFCATSFYTFFALIEKKVVGDFLAPPFETERLLELNKKQLGPIL